MSSPVIAPFSPGLGSPLAVFSPSTVSGSFPQMHELYPPSPTLSMPEQLHTQHHPHPHQHQQYLHQQHRPLQHPYQHHAHTAAQSHIPAHYNYHRQTRPTLSAQQLRSLQQIQIEQAMYERQFKIEQELQEQYRQAQRREQQRQEQQRQEQLLHQQAQSLQHPLRTQLSSQSDKSKPPRRWSLTGRLFEKRKSAPESVQSHPPSAPSSRTTPSTSNSCSTGRRSSLTDLPKAFLSSLRRTSLSGPGDGGTHASPTHASPSIKEPCVIPLPMGEPVEKVISLMSMSMTDEDNNDEEPGTATILTSTGLRQASFATPKAPPQIKSHPKSILKKRSFDAGTSIGFPHPSPQASKIEPIQDPSSENALPTMGAASDHCALGSRSPGPPSQPMALSWTAGARVPPASFSGTTSEAFEFGVWSPAPKETTLSPLLSSLFSKSDLSPLDLSPPSTPHRALSHGAAFPPDFMPEMQSNSYHDRGGEPPQGEILSLAHSSFPPQHFVGGESAEHAQQQQLENTIRCQTSEYLTEGPFTSSDSMVASGQEGLSQDYGQAESGRSISVGGSGPTNGMGSNGVLSGNGMNRRCINFLDTIEIIPAHRKSDYNRRSDKNATFKILTADMKSEIREELNSYKLREMAVHIDSMGNTAFH